MVTKILRWVRFYAPMNQASRPAMLTRCYVSPFAGKLASVLPMSGHLSHGHVTQQGIHDTPPYDSQSAKRQKRPVIFRVSACLGFSPFPAHPSCSFACISRTEW